MSIYEGKYLTIGPPGTGKTTWLGTQVRTCVDRGSTILVSSLTRTAAAEVTGRDLPVPKDHIATLHAHAYRTIGRPPIAAKSIDDWNKRHPEFKMSGDGTAVEDPYTASQMFAGDKVYEAIDLRRHRCQPETEWSPELREFFREWQAWKSELGVVDFTDMIELAIRQSDSPPHRPDVLLVDEAQDLSALEYRLLTHWARTAKALICVGDPWQALYTWRGADPSLFDDPAVTDDHRRVLGQSYRVPREIHRAATTWIKQLSTYRDIVYHPTDDNGVAQYFRDATYKGPLSMVQKSDTTTRARDVSVMILASCAYIIEETIQILRGKGIPFANPWRTKRGDWNPLRPRKGATTMAQRLVAFFKPLSQKQKTHESWCSYCAGKHRVFDDRTMELVECPHCKLETGGISLPRWTRRDLGRWVELLSSKRSLHHGVKSIIKRRAEESPNEYVTDDDITVYFKPEILGFVRKMFNGATEVCDCTSWLKDNILSSKLNAITYPLAVISNRGIQGLTEKPKIYVGTIHSFKGAEADIVFVAPEVSFSAWRQAMLWGRDDLIRLFYVAMTRAKRELYVLERCEKMSMELI